MAQRLLHIMLPAGLVLVLLFAVPCGGVHGDTAGEYAVKAALVLNFARFTDWPSEALTDSPDTVLLCVAGDGAAGEAFAEMDGKLVGTRRLSVRSLRDPRRLQGCQLLYVVGSDRSRLPQIFAAAEGQPVLTIGEMTDFARLGGMVNLVKADRKIRFQVNLGAADRAGLKISSRILKLATIVGEPQKNTRQ